MTTPPAGRRVPDRPGLRIVIVGAGIGGLTAALTLAAGGHDVTLVERATGFSAIGAGLQLSPNASRVLIDLGLGASLRRMAGEPERVRIRSLGGREIGGVALGETMRERFGAPYWVIHRADLQTVLLDAVRGRPGIRLLVGRTATALGETADEASVTIETAGGRGEVLTADLVVCADGVRSALRPRLDRRPLKPLGAAAWRATLPRAEAPDGFSANETGLWLGRDRHVVHYPIRGGERINLVAVMPQAPGETDWSASGDPERIRAAFADAAAPLRALIAAPEDWLAWTLADRAAARPMARGRIALLGDAAHPVLPFLAQGAALAIEDAADLAARLAADPVPKALARYAAVRAARAGRVQSHARRNGRLYHSGRLVAAARDAVMARLGPEGMTARYAWLYGWRPESHS
ncbi:FAD-dependent monooxygenase [uncultured Methylobacterium sp.]|uniref:FAD-dependent monooxygenase n=1 Tax=uncultured Methylobacterium sp. TaxID=157278 RepID=UPI002633B57A|nr:FAD-dependent monooxygenase [uncultured Methylobacterium sp.]